MQKMKVLWKKRQTKEIVMMGGRILNFKKLTQLGVPSLGYENRVRFYSCSSAGYELMAHSGIQSFGLPQPESNW
jgi:hypothetical protein